VICYGLERWVSIPDRDKRFSLYSVQTGSGSSLAPYPMGTGGSFFPQE
jgi:hypothetical protein